jgi:hypothetical protein
MWLGAARQPSRLRKYLRCRIRSPIRLLIVSSEAPELNHMPCSCNLVHISHSVLPALSPTSLPEYHETQAARPLERVTSQQSSFIYRVADPDRRYEPSRFDRYHINSPSHTKNLNAISHSYRRRRHTLFRNQFLYILQFPLPAS